MSKKIIIEKNQLTTRLAYLVEDEFVQFHVDSILEPNLQNKIVIGQVMQVVKNLNAVFVDYGDKKNGMLHFKQIPDAYQNKVQVGYRLPVQIVKQNTGDKGHKLTSKLNLIGKYLVCLPFETGINISKKITCNTWRETLKARLVEATENDFGFIVRTHAEEATLEEIIEDAKALIQQAKQILEQSKFLSKGSILYEEPSASLQIIMEHMSKKEALEIVCNEQHFLTYLKELSRHYPYHDEIKWTLCDEGHTLFSCYMLQKKIDELLKRKIWLKNGGNLVIDYTEAMTIMDVNSAKAIVTKNPEKMVLTLNKEATKEAILQMLRRNLSGIIIVDLVEMKHIEHKEIIFEYAKMLLEQYGDKRTKVYPLTELGLLQFSRTKKYQCIPHQLLESCRSCRMSYAKESFLQEMISVENQIKALDLEVKGKQPVFLEVHSEYYEFLKHGPVISLLEAAYPIKIQLKKSEVNENKKILCQFYQR